MPVMNLPIIANVLRLYSITLKSTRIHSSPGLSSDDNIVHTVTVDASGKPSIIGISYSSQLSPRCINAERPYNVRFSLRFRFLCIATNFMTNGILSDNIDLRHMNIQ